MSQSCHCEAPQGPWQSRRTVLNFRKISANSKHFTGDSHVASLLGMTKRRLFAIPRIPRCFPLVFPPKPPAGQLFRQPVSQKRNVPPRKPDGQLVEKSLRVFCQAAFKIAKLFVVLFCNFAAAAGYLTRKDTLTVSFPSFLPSETSGWTGFSTPRRKNKMYRPASRTVSLSKSPFGSFAKLPSKLQNFL